MTRFEGPVVDLTRNPDFIRSQATSTSQHPSPVLQTRTALEAAVVIAELIESARSVISIYVDEPEYRPFLTGGQLEFQLVSWLSGPGRSLHIIADNHYRSYASRSRVGVLLSHYLGEDLSIPEPSGSKPVWYQPAISFINVDNRSGWFNAHRAHPAHVGGTYRFRDQLWGHELCELFVGLSLPYHRAVPLR